MAQCDGPPEHDSPQRNYLLAINRTIAVLILSGALALAAGMWLPAAMSADRQSGSRTAPTQSPK
ncbi:MAG: hypothetical protein ACRC0L_07495 [Angustibacter sp.]